MKFLKQLVERGTKTATEEVRKEVKETALDILPTIVTIGVGLIALVACKGSPSSGPSSAVTHVTTSKNYYFIGEGMADILDKVVKDALK